VRSDLATEEQDRHPAIGTCGRLDVATMSHGKPMDAVVAQQALAEALRSEQSAPRGIPSRASQCVSAIISS
jgi:hypothetical protein